MRFIGALMGVVFGLFFSGAGGFIALETAVPTYVRWTETQEWSATEGKVIEAGGENNGVTAVYQYEVAGKAYQSERVHLADFKDNIGSYHVDMRRYLVEKRRSGQPVTVWFNPDDPADSMIDRDMRWGLFTLMMGFCSVFIVTGLAIAVASLKGKGVELVVDLSGVIEFKDLFGAADDFIEIKGCLPDLSYNFGFCGLNDLLSVF